MHLHSFFTQSKHYARFCKDRRVMPLHRFQQAQRRIIARARPYCWVKPRHGFKVVIVHIRACGNDRLDRGLGFVTEVRCQNFNRRVWRIAAQRLNDLYELTGAAIRQVIAVNGRNDNMFKAHLGRCNRHMLWFKRVNRAWHPCFNVAERTSPCANIPQDHHRSMLLRPAFADIGTRRFFAHGV